MLHEQHHRTRHSGKLRAAVLGADDGAISTASLFLGVTPAAASRGQVLLAGVARLIAGAMAMAAGHDVSIGSQRIETGRSLALERPGLERRGDGKSWLRYVERGLDHNLVAQVTSQFYGRDALGTHAREELGISEQLPARPRQAAAASAASFHLRSRVSPGNRHLLFPLLLSRGLSSPFHCSRLSFSAPWRRAPATEMTRGNPPRIVPGRFDNGVTASLGRLFRANFWRRHL